jgi:hypothetical protein
MSYLDLPRLCFAGSFFANPSTINNKLANYSPDVRLLPAGHGQQALSVLEEYAGFQYINPYGLANFFLSECVITGWHTEGGGISGGCPFGTVASGAPYAKMVDLDPDQQSISQIYGLQLRVRLWDGSGFDGIVEPACLHDLWYGRVPSASGDRKASGCFQSLITLERITWTPGTRRHSIAGALRERCRTGISVKWTLDAYQGDPNCQDFNYGRIVGVFGPGLPDEPVRFAAERRLNTCGSVFGPAYWKLDPPARRVTLDLSNSLPLRQPAGESIDVILRAVVLRQGRQEPLLSTTLDSSRAALHTRAGIIDLQVTEQQSRLLAEHPLGITAESRERPAGLVLQEHESLKWIHCDPTWLRLAPGQNASVTFHARHAGQPLADEVIDLEITRHPINNRPRCGVRFPSLVTTDERGQAQVTIEAYSPQPLPPRRAVIDSQVYYIGGRWQVAGELIRQSGGGALSVLVFNETPRIETPSWVDHVGPLLTYYARLYPGMAKVLGFGTYEGTCANAEFLRQSLSRPHEDPLHFPPSRDMSPEKARMLCRWIESGMSYE